MDAEERTNVAKADLKLAIAQLIDAYLNSWHVPTLNLIPGSELWWTFFKALDDDVKHRVKMQLGESAIRFSDNIQASQEDRVTVGEFLDNLLEEL